MWRSVAAAGSECSASFAAKAKAMGSPRMVGQRSRMVGSLTPFGEAGKARYVRR
jgi:hypothetical protein